MHYDGKHWPALTLGYCNFPWNFVIWAFLHGKWAILIEFPANILWERKDCSLGLWTFCEKGECRRLSSDNTTTGKAHETHMFLIITKNYNFRAKWASEVKRNMESLNSVSMKRVEISRSYSSVVQMRKIRLFCDLFFLRGSNYSCWIMFWLTLIILGPILKIFLSVIFGLLL